MISEDNLEWLRAGGRRYLVDPDSLSARTRSRQGIHHRCPDPVALPAPPRAVFLAAGQRERHHHLAAAIPPRADSSSARVLPPRVGPAARAPSPRRHGIPAPPAPRRCLLPPYAPELNPVELFWAYLKHNSLPNFAASDAAQWPASRLAMCLRSCSHLLRSFFDATPLFSSRE